MFASAAFLVARRTLVENAPKFGLTAYLVFTSCIVTLICIAYASFIEPYDLHVTRISLSFTGLPPETKPITLVQISDTHCDSTKRLENRVSDEVSKAKPDLILFTGDAINSQAAKPVFQELVDKLKGVAPILAVKGDWDFAFHPHDVLRECGLDVVSGFRIIELNGVKFCIVGADSGASCKDALTHAPKGLPTIMIFHNPDADVVLNDEMDNIDLYLCGHTHGGQIALPLYGALITQSIQGKKYEYGLHKLQKTWLYTSRGIGMEGHFPRLRFCAPPEITIFTLRGQSTPGN